MKLKNVFLLILLFGFGSCKTSQTGISKIDFDAFHKTEINPILKADSTFVFDCPIKKTIVKWQSADVFNPAAIVKDGNSVFFVKMWMS